jgi:hypothetical protein
VRLISEQERVASENSDGVAAECAQGGRESGSMRGIEAAAANLALVEKAAERDLDGEEMQRTLAEIPKDLYGIRSGSIWNAKLESSEVSARAED